MNDKNSDPADVDDDDKELSFGILKNLILDINDIISQKTISNCSDKLKKWQADKKENDIEMNFVKRTTQLQELLDFTIQLIVWIKIRRIKYAINFPELDNEIILRRLTTPTHTINNIPTEED